MNKIHQNRLQSFLYDVFHPLWKFILGGPPFIYGWFVFFRDEFMPPEQAAKLRLGSIFNMIDWYWWVIGGLFILWLITAWSSSRKDKQSKNSDSIENINPQLAEEQKFSIFPTIEKNNKWLSIVIRNPLSETVECYFSLTLIELNGEAHEEIRRFVTEQTSRISISGGNRTGKEDGLMSIEDESIGIFNLVRPSHNGLIFEMAKGPRTLDHSFQYGTGTYKVNLVLKYKIVGDSEFQRTTLDVNFYCYIEDKNTETSLSKDVISCEFNPGGIRVWGDNKRKDKLCVKVVR